MRPGRARNSEVVLGVKTEDIILTIDWGEEILAPPLERNSESRKRTFAEKNKGEQDSADTCGLRLTWVTYEKQKKLHTEGKAGIKRAKTSRSEGQSAQIASYLALDRHIPRYREGSGGQRGRMRGMSCAGLNKGKAGESAGTAAKERKEEEPEEECVLTGVNQTGAKKSLRKLRLGGKKRFGHNEKKKKKKNSGGTVGSQVHHYQSGFGLAT